MARPLVVALLLTFTISAYAAETRLGGETILSAADRQSRYVVVRIGETTKLYAVPRDGSSPSLLTTELGTPRRLYVDDAFVYWTSERGTERVTKDGWEREVVSTKTAAK